MGLPGVSVDIGGAVVAAGVFVEEELLEKVVERSERLGSLNSVIQKKIVHTTHTYNTYRETWPQKVACYNYVYVL